MLEERQEEIARRYEINIEAVMKSMAAAIHFDPRKLFDAEGRLKPITALEDNTVLALQSFKLATLKGTGGEGDTPLNTAEIKWESKATTRDQASPCSNAPAGWLEPPCADWKMSTSAT